MKYLLLSLLPHKPKWHKSRNLIYLRSCRNLFQVQLKIAATTKEGLEEIIFRHQCYSLCQSSK